MRLTKKQALQSFRELWSEFIKDHPSYRGDTIAKREDWNNYIDSLHKDGQITDWQVNNWTNPF